MKGTKMLTRIKYYAILGLALGASSASHAALIGFWGFNPSPAVTDVTTVGPITLGADPNPGPSVTPPYQSGASLAVFGKWKAPSDAGGVNWHDFTPASSGGQFLAVTPPAAPSGEIIITVDRATLFNYVITYAAQAGQTGQLDEQWAWSSDGGSTWNPVTFTSTAADGGWTAETVSFVGQPIPTDAGTVQFRDTFKVSTPGSDFLFLDNIQINAIPEPANIALAGFGLCAVGILFGRRICTRLRS